MVKINELSLSADIRKPLHNNVPARTKLYSLEPMGLGTPMVESLSSYIIRLAYAHQVSVNQLVKYIISYNNFSGIKNISLRSLNGMVSSRYLIDNLEVLTNQKNLVYLSTIPWSKHITTGYLRYQKVWCPICFLERNKSEQIMYEPLIWYYIRLDICYYHHVPLVSQCPSCQCSSNITPNKSTIGFCSKCSSFLGFDSSEEKITLTNWDYTKINNLGKAFGGKEADTFLKNNSSMVLFTKYKLYNSMTDT